MNPQAIFLYPDFKLDRSSYLKTVIQLRTAIMVTISVSTEIVVVSFWLVLNASVLMGCDHRDNHAVVRLSEKGGV